MRRLFFSVALVLGVAGAALVVRPSPILGQGSSRFDRENVNGRDVVAREVLVKFRQRGLPSDLAQIRAENDADDVRAIGRTGVLRLRSRSANVETLMARLSRRPDVAYVEPNYIVRIDSEPNDPRFPELWALRNIGQVIGGMPGLAGADIHTVPAWSMSLGSPSNVVAVIDTGIDYTHPDLAANMWSAPTAFTVNVGGGPVTCAAGTHGFNAISRTCNPMDDQDHGTHVAGTIGATGDNGLGVVGINWITRLMAIKFIDATGNGTTADAIAAVEFAIAVKQRFAGTPEGNIRVLSNSWGGNDFSQALLDEVRAANDENMLFVAGAGNDSFDNDLLPFYPASFDSPNVISVAATDNIDDLAWFSNFGASSVHLGAPGVDILSTTIGNHYEYLSGTSMATPHVSGAAALVLSGCAVDTAELKETLVGTVDPVPALAGNTTSGGRLNVYSALYACTNPPQTPANLTAHGLDTKVVLSWSAALGATRYNVKRSLTPGGPYSSINSAVHGTTYTDTAVVNGTTYYYVVSASNSRGDSGDSNEASATPNVPPDVYLTTFTTPALAGSDSTIVVSVTTKNQGPGTAAASTTKVYWSEDSVLDSSDAVLAGQAVPQLVTGAISSASVPVVIPTTTTGRHYLIARADADDVLSESSETNNNIVRSIQIGPDLVVTALTVPGSGAADSTIIVNDTTKNQGGGSAAASITRFYLSTNSVLDAADTLLPGGRDVPVLDAGVSNPGSTVVTIPASTAPGTYYILAKADADGTLTETTETNNTFARSIVVGSDLVVSTITAPAKSGAGATITVNDTTTNTGGAPTTASVTRLYFSTNSTLDAGDTLLGVHQVPDLAPGGADAGSTSVTVPQVVPGSYYIVARADDDNVVLESRETNNTLVKAIAIGGDLVVSTFTAPSAGGAGLPMTVSDTTTNQGGGSLGPTTTKFYVSVNSIFDAGDTLLGGRAVPALDAGGVNTGSTTVTLPPSLSAGTYYLIAKADADATAVETLESNNTVVRSVQVGSDLAVPVIGVPAKGAAGSAIVVTETTTNQGGGDAPASVTTFYLAASATPGPGDQLLDGSHAVPALAAGGSSAGSTTVTIPAGTAPGTLYIIAKADAGNVVAETSETNNIKARSIAIGPDLAVTSFTLSATSVAAGAAVNMTDTVTNQGAGIAAPSTTRFYLSTNAVLDASDVLLAPGRAMPQVNGGALSSGTTSVTIPVDSVPRTYYLIAKADADGVVAESVETNNLSAVRTIQVTAAP